MQLRVQCNPKLSDWEVIVVDWFTKIDNFMNILQIL